MDAAPFIASGVNYHLDELTKAFLTKFFPSSKMVNLRNQITTFTRRKDDSLYEVGSSSKTYCGHAPSWTLKVDDSPEFLQQSHSIVVLYY